MADINRLASPMIVYEVDFLDSPLEQEELRESVCQGLTKPPASFLIGSMETVNQKISLLEDWLRTCSSDDQIIQAQDVMTRSYTVKNAQNLEKADSCTVKAMSRELFKEDLHAFAQKYERSMQRMESAEHAPVKKHTKKKIMAPPILVELQRFPGFVDDGSPPMPNGTRLSMVLENVVAAHNRSCCKMQLCAPKDLFKFLRTPIVRCIVLDSFWWIFLHKYQPDPETQALLFDRIAKCYVHLLQQCGKGLEGDTFLKCLPSVMSQAVYSSFCFSFPDSATQFRDDGFLSMLCNILWEWFTGIQPSLEIYISWDFVSLEPKKNKEENSARDPKKKGSPLSLLHVDSFDATAASMLPPAHHSELRCSSLPQMSRRSSSLPHKAKSSKYSLDLPCPKSDRLRENEEVSRSFSVPASSHKHHSLKHNAEASGLTATPGKLKLLKSWSTTVPKESHPMCHGPTFVKNIFDVNGHSPLLQHYLWLQNVKLQSGCDRLLQWTGIQKPVPSCSETYASMVNQAFRRLQKKKTEVRAQYHKQMKESANFRRWLLDSERGIMRKKKEILPAGSEIKRLSQQERTDVWMPLELGSDSSLLLKEF